MKSTGIWLDPVYWNYIECILIVYWMYIDCILELIFVGILLEFCMNYVGCILGSFWICTGLYGAVVLCNDSDLTWFYILFFIIFYYFDIDMTLIWIWFDIELYLNYIELILIWYWFDYVKLIPCWFEDLPSTRYDQDMYKIRSRYVRDMYKGVIFLDKIRIRLGPGCQYGFNMVSIFWARVSIFVTRFGQGWRSQLRSFPQLMVI